MAAFSPRSHIVDASTSEVGTTEGGATNAPADGDLDTKSPSTNDTETVDEQLKSNLIVKYLPLTTTQEALRYLFAPYGNITACKLIKDRATGQSLGYGFVKFDTDASAAKAVEALNAYTLDNKTIRVIVARPPQEQVQTTSKSNVYIAGLPKNYTKAMLDDMYAVYGKIVESRVLLDQQGVSRGIGFVRFENPAHATKAIAGTNGTTLAEGAEQLVVKFAREGGARMQAYRGRPMMTPDYNGYVPMHPMHRRDQAIPYGYTNGVAPGGPAMTENDYYRSPYPYYGYVPQSPAHMYDQQLPPYAPNDRSGVCLFVFHLPPEVKEEEMFQLFSTAGTVYSVKIITDPATQQSKGYGFVNMATQQEAQNAIYTLNGHRMGNKYLKVSFKKKKGGY